MIDSDVHMEGLEEHLRLRPYYRKGDSGGMEVVLLGEKGHEVKA